MRKLGLLFLFVSLVGCGRGQSDLYRAYNVNPMHDSSGKITEDLATQNRNSLQSGGELSYQYVAPEQADSESTTKSADESQTEDETATETTTDDATIPDDVAAADSSEGTDAVIGKIDALKQSVSKLNKK